jgi:hypothetical protein
VTEHGLGGGGLWPLLVAGFASAGRIMQQDVSICGQTGVVSTNIGLRHDATFTVSACPPCGTAFDSASTPPSRHLPFITDLLKSVEQWIVCTPLSVKVFITLATQ